MSVFEDAEKVQDFVKDLIPVMKKHNAKINILKVNVRGIIANCVDPMGVDPDNCLLVPFEVGPDYNSETVLFNLNPPPKTHGMVFNPAGVDSSPAGRKGYGIK